jgi:hypothetical protein
VTTIIVSGAIANKCFQGGEAWVRLSWILGLQKLGFKVFLLEQIDRQMCVDSSGKPTSFQDSLGRAYFQEVTEQFGLSGSAALIYEGGQETWGLSSSEIFAIAEEAELLVNISGHLRVEPILRRVGRKAYVDLDPGFTQFWDASGIVGANLEGHDFYFTVGENIGTPRCSIPAGGFRWRPIRPPVVLDEWPITNSVQSWRFTTVANWRGSFGPITFQGKTYGLKVHEFRKLLKLPELSRQRFEIALSIHPSDETDLEALQQHGWHIVDPKKAAGSLATFRNYVQASAAEFSVAQGIYVDTWSGWFSDRTTRYLASGKPALVQATGFSRTYPVGEGLLSFCSLEEAVRGTEQIVRDYERHSRAARKLAEEYFDSNKVLGRFIEEVGISP